MNNIERIKSKEDFLKFLSNLIKDFKNNPNEWENKTIDSFLEGMHGWVEDMDGYYGNMGIEKPENLDWKTMANILMASKMYE